MNCPDCGLENPPVRDACAFCETPILAGERREEWENLTPALREEFSKNFERALEARKAWREKLVRGRARHAAMGALLNVVMTGLTHAPAGAAGALHLLMDLALGAAAGVLLNQLRGGAYLGMSLFGGAYFVSAALKLALGALRIDLLFCFFVFPGFLAALSLGYLFGTNLSMKRTLEE